MINTFSKIPRANTVDKQWSGTSPSRAQSAACGCSSSFAPGEIILFGEHSVVYGRRALALAISRGVTSKFYPAEKIEIISSLGRLEGVLLADGIIKYKRCDKPLEPFKIMIGRIFSYAGKCRGFRARISSGLPAASGLASSAAVSASFMLGLMRFLGKKVSKEKLLALVYEGELAIQKRGSIIGSASAVYGGLIEVYKGKVKKLPAPKLDACIIVADSKQACPTSITTGIVKKKLQGKPVWCNKVFDFMDAIATLGKERLLKKDMFTVGRLCAQNQKYLAVLGVSTPKIERYLKEISPYVYGSKITGAGGGGCVFSILDKKNAAAVMRLAKKNGMSAFCAQLSNGGAR